MTFRDHLAAADRALAGIWVCSGSPLIAEICAGSGIDWTLIDMEHSPNGLESVLAQLQAIAAYDTTAVVRVPINDWVIIKQVLDTGAQNLIVPMVANAEEAREAVAAMHYPPLGRRGVGSALARSARWSRVPNYLTEAGRHVSLLVQIESGTAVANAAEIAAVDGVDGVFIGPADLAASLGHLGQQDHPEVRAAVLAALAAAKAAGKAAGVNAFDPEVAQGYIDAGADFVVVGSDVTLLARGSEALARRFIPLVDAAEDTY